MLMYSAAPANSAADITAANFSRTMGIAISIGVTPSHERSGRAGLSCALYPSSVRPMRWLGGDLMKEPAGNGRCGTHHQDNNSGLDRADSG
jgi:hypothetical protein